MKTTHRYCPITPGETLNNKYSVLKNIGSGAFCSVWQAKSSAGGDFAIKIFRNGDYNLEDFAKEYEILKHLNSVANDPAAKYVAKIYEIFAHINLSKNVVSIHPCSVMPLYGDSISKYLDRKDRAIELAAAKKIMREFFTALDFIHRNNVIHSDIKADNLLMTKKVAAIKNDMDIQIVLVDFDNSVFSAEKNVTYCGKREYLSPELVLMLPYDFKTDIWSAGCLLFELLTNRFLFSFHEEEPVDEAKDGESESESESGSESNSQKGESPKQDGGGDENSEQDGDGEEFNTSDSEGDRYLQDYSHLKLFESLLGRPPKRFIKKGGQFYNKYGRLKNNPEIKPINIEEMLVADFKYEKNAAAQISQFLTKMIQYKPTDRMSAADLLAHPFLAANS